MTTELYKKYRPKTLDRVIGNEETVKALGEMLKKKTVPHTILFSGPSGCGKTTLARILGTELGCGEMDFSEMNCSDFRGIDTIRDLRKVMSLAPVGGSCRFFLLDEVHNMSKDAQNAALKMWEDTPSHVYFALVTTDPGKLLPTVRTRCSNMPVRLLEREEVKSLVKRVSKKEGISLEKRDISNLADYCEGSARTALVLLDKIRNLPAKDREEAMKQKNEEETQSIELCRALIKKSPWPVVSKILKGLKGEPETIRRGVLGYARNVLLSGKNEQAYLVLCAFDGHFYDTGAAGLARACFEAIFGD